MAINPNFVFRDPALQAQVVNAQQVQAAAETARAQQMAETLRALQQQRQAQADKQERRSDREADIRRLDATEAERRRQFDANLGLAKERLAAEKEVAGTSTKTTADRDLYNNLLFAIEKSGDPPTVSELEAKMVGLTDQQKNALRDRRKAVYDAAVRDFSTAEGEARRLQALVGTKDKKGNTYDADSLVKGKNFLRIHPDTGEIESLIRRPREDAVARPMRGAAESITDVLGRVTKGVMSDAARGIGRIPEETERLGTIGGLMTHPLGVFGGLGELAGRAFGPGQAPQVARPVFAPPPPSAFAPPMMGNQGVLMPPDYSGPEYDYSGRFRVPPVTEEDYLAPPVFAPAY